MPDIFGLSFIHFSSIFAVAGGGGSGGSGGGGGIGAGLFLIGYIPMHASGAIIRKAKKYEAEWVLGQGIGWGIATVYCVLFIVIAIHTSLLAIIIAIGSPIGMGAGLYGWFGKLKQNRLTKQALVSAAQSDSAWDEQTLLAYTSDIFIKYQNDWTYYDTEAMKAYMTPTYQNHAALMIYALQLAGRRDSVNSPEISQATVTNVYDVTDNSQDEVIIGFTAKSNDQLVDTRDNKIIFTDNNAFTEYWRFRRSDNNWLLDGIQPATANQWTSNPSLEQFAAQQGYYYSLDWGWLLLPSKGQLFGDGKFGVSDINNHVIGMYNKCLVQLYSYTPRPGANNKTYLIAQTNVPKSYGEILVRHKSGFHPFGVHGLNKISMEWPDFNDKYEVYASDVEQVTSFELLDPVFMEKLEALPFEVNINVVDNVVYLYAAGQLGSSNIDSYQTMLGILQKAFEQMRL